MKKLLLGLSLVACGYLQAQTDKFWSSHHDRTSKITTDKSVARTSFPKEFDLYDLNIEPLRQALFSLQNKTGKVTITLPNADGGIEQFEMFEASNFDADLQARFPQIRAYSGKGITDRYATLKLSISPEGIQSMVFRTDKENEFIEPYSQDHTIYAVFKSQREKGKLPWSCSTKDADMFREITAQLPNTQKSSAAQLKTMRLAQSCTAEYSNYFGATSASQVNLVVAAFNNTLTRCNGVYEKDLALHLNLISNTTSVIYYNASTDPYSAASSGAGGAWNSELQNTLTSVIGDANYDIGHLFGASGGGGNAGCIGCVCTNGSKGSGFTSPADGIPSGDNFDIDYVVHEVGHQLGGNHTFSHSNEGTGVNMEVGSGVTIMGYAGITSQDIAPHSIDAYHAATIAQIQANLAGKTCPVTTSISANNATPVANAGSDYTIPKSTPFMLTGSATDANAGDALTYSWEQYDNASSSQTGASSVASATKATGPNWRSWLPTASPVRYFPIMATVLAGGTTTNGTGNEVIAVEALSSVARTLNFRLTVRDNAAFSAVAPVKVGQTNFDDMVVTVNATAGPFAVTAPNTAVSYAGGSSQAVTWNVAGTTANGVNCANVDILISTNGGSTWSTLLAGTPNDGTENVTIPNTASTTCRIMIKGTNHIFFDVSNANFTITASSSDTTAPTAPTNLAASGTTQTTTNLSWTASTDNVAVTGYDVYQGATLKGSSTTTSFAVTGLTASTTYSFTVKAKDAAGNVSAASNAVSVTTLAPTTDTTAPTVPTNLAASGTTQTTTNLSWTASTDNVAVTGYDVYQGATLKGSSTTTSFAVTGLTAATTYSFTVKAKDAAGNVSAASNPVSVTTLSGGITYCTSQGNNTADEKIGKVVMGTISNTSTGTAGYENFTSLSTSAAQNSSQTITITPSWTSSTYAEGYAVFIDYNQNGVFTDAGETVWTKAASTTTPVSGTFTIPSSATLGATRMRVSMKYNGIPTSCEAFSYGQVEDYTVNITAGGGGTLTYCASQGNSTTDEKIGKVAMGTISNTSTGTAGYEDFTSLSATVTKGSSQTITVTPSWTSTVYPEGYAVFIDYNQNGVFTDAGETVWTSAASTTTPVSGTFTIPTTATSGNTRMRVSMKYNGVPTSCEAFSYGQVEDYTVNISATGKEFNAGNSLNEMTLYPNPASSTVNVTNVSDAATFKIYNLLGQMILDGKIVHGSIAVSNINPGNYILEVSDENNTVTKRFIKE